MKAMEKSPEVRYNSAAEMLSDIERFRLNPTIVFDYGKSFVDNQPTKFVGDIKDTKKDDVKPASKSETLDFSDDDFSDDDDIKQHSNAFHAIKGILIAAILVCAVIFSLAMFKGCNSSQAKDVTVPDYIGKSLVDVKENNKNGFNFEIKSKFDESKEMGVILAQDPAPDSMKVKTGSTITLTVNGTDTMVSTPYVTNYSEKEAIRVLKASNLVAEIVYVENTKTPKGYVNETYPKAGVQTTIGSTVYVYVANGKRTEQVTLPSVEGLVLSEAKSKIEELGLTVEVVYDDESKEAKDTVLGMSPLQYGKVDLGTVVTLTVSSGLGDKNTVSVFVDLPSNTEDTVEMTVIVDGVVDNQYSKTLVPKYNKTCTLEITGSGTSTIIVQLDGQLYREYHVDFSKSAVTTTGIHDYVVATTEPYTYYTEPTTEPYTYYTEPTTEPYTEDPNLNNGYNDYNGGFY